MNKARRKQIDELAQRMQELLSDIEAVKDEEQDYFDNMPENMLSGEKASASEEALSTLEDAVSNAESALESLQNVAGT